LTISGAIHVGMSEILRQWNDLDGGVRHALAGIEYGRRGRSLGVQVCGYTRLALLLQARGDVEGAARAFQRAAQLAPLRRKTSFIFHHDVQASLWGRQGNLDAALHWARENHLLSGLDPVGETSYLNEAGHLTVVRLLLRLKRPQEADRLAGRLRVSAESAGRSGRVIEILALQALARSAVGSQSQAVETLLQALELAEPQGSVRVFVDEGEIMGLRANFVRAIADCRLLIEERRAKGDSQELSRLVFFIDKILAAFSSSIPIAIHRSGTGNNSAIAQKNILINKSAIRNRQSAILDPLSERETEILQLVASGLSNREIAEKLYVAPSTVHWHVKNIYGKLDVHSRTQAVARAGELGILIS
jgi:LuxR family maltose regulon positive regulatory protein